MTAADAGAQPIRITGGSPTDEEIAAITAVLTQLATRRAAVVERVQDPDEHTAWDRTRRPLRTPLTRDGRWRDR